MEPLGEIIMSAKGLIEHKNALSVAGSNGDIARPALSATPRVGNKRPVKKLGTNVAKPAVPDRKLTQVACEKILNAIVYGQLDLGEATLGKRPCTRLGGQQSAYPRESERTAA